MDFRKTDLGRCPFFFLFISEANGDQEKDFGCLAGSGENLERERYLLKKERFEIEIVKTNGDQEKDFGYNAGSGENLERERYLLEKEIFEIENGQSKRKERMVKEEILDLDIQWCFFFFSTCLYEDYIE